MLHAVTATATTAITTTDDCRAVKLYILIHRRCRAPDSLCVIFFIAHV